MESNTGIIKMYLLQSLMKKAEEQFFPGKKKETNKQKNKKPILRQSESLEKNSVDYNQKD